MSEIEIFRQLRQCAIIRTWNLLIRARSGRRYFFDSTDAVKVTETAGNGKPIRSIRKLKASEELPSGDVIIKNGWDHEHCELCWTHVDPGDYAYRDEHDEWLCVSCFEEREAK